MSTLRSDAVSPAPLADPESLEQLLGDCRRLAERWKAPAGRPLATGAAAGPRSAAPGPRGVTVSALSAHVVAGMAEFGD